MSQQVIDFLEENYHVDRELGAINAIEAWWVERQEALEPAGYMLRPRYRADWKPSWEGTKKLYFRCEDGQIKVVSRYLRLLVPLFMNLVAFGHGCNSDLRRKTCDVEKASQRRGSVRAPNKPAFLHRAPPLEPEKSLCTAA
jgi:hypothetical protein